MNTSLIIEKSIKERASKRANAYNLSVSAVARILLSDFADGYIDIGTRSSGKQFYGEQIVVDTSTQKLMDKVITKWNNLHK